VSALASEAFHEQGAITEGLAGLLAWRSSPSRHLGRGPRLDAQCYDFFVPENEATLADELARTLCATGIEARATGRGVHWKVEVAPGAARSLVVHCFWYDARVSGLFLGMNPANGRSHVRRGPVAREGAEYMVKAHEGGACVVDGRTGLASEVVVCTRAWVGGATLEALSSIAPFMDQKGRAMRAIATRLDARLRFSLGGDPSYDLWIYGSNRSCRVTEYDGEVDCALFVGQAQMAFVSRAADVPALTSWWLLEQVPVSLLKHLPDVELERHAEVLEVEPARWHWLHVGDRLRNPHDVLAPLGDLVAALAARPLPSSFFSFSSLNRFCFSASSHSPWVNRGLPTIAPAGDGAYEVNGTRCDLARAVELVEAILAAYPVRPFFGSAPHHQLSLVSDALARQGSTLRPFLQQREEWCDLVVEKGPRRCLIDERSVVFVDGTRRDQRMYSSLEAAATGVRDYLERE
jgi:hypothetical protein